MEEAQKIKVTYIHHSAFCVEVDGRVLVFDYYDGSVIESCPYHGRMPEFPKDTPLYVFSSHSHGDHFDPKVLKWSLEYSRIHYIFAKEIKRKLGNSALQRLGFGPDIREKITYVRPDERVELSGIRIQTLQSTDQGVAFLAECGGRTIYHAGDLNWWHWQGEPKEANRWQETVYKEQIDKLAGRQLDIAFVVLDPRQGQDQYLGLEYFAEHVDVSHIIPMHLWKKYDSIPASRERFWDREWAKRLVAVERENQEFIFE